MSDEARMLAERNALLVVENALLDAKVKALALTVQSIAVRPATRAEIEGIYRERFSQIWSETCQAMADDAPGTASRLKEIVDGAPISFPWPNRE